MHHEVERILTVAAGAARVWETVVCGAWLGDDGVIDPRPGGDGWVREGDELRHLVVEGVDDGRRLVFRWWPLSPEGIGPASRVSIDVTADDEAEDAEAHARVVVVETPLAAGTPIPDSTPMAMATI